MYQWALNVAELVILNEFTVQETTISIGRSLARFFMCSLEKNTNRAPDTRPIQLLIDSMR